MLVRYRMNSNCTIANMMSDLDKIITCVANSTNLSAGCDSGNTQFLGSYPANTYAQVGNTANTFTYSKNHNEYANTTHYFRLEYDTEKLVNLVVAQGYSSGPGTLLNSRPVYHYRSVGTLTADFVGPSTLTGALFNIDNLSRLWPQANGVAGNVRIGDTITHSWSYDLTTASSSFFHQPYVLNRMDHIKNTMIPQPIVISGQTSGTAGSTGTYLVGFGTPTLPDYANAWYNLDRPENADIRPFPHDTRRNNHGLDIIVTSKCMVISSPRDGCHVGFFDIAKNGISRVYTDNMLMAGIDLMSPEQGVTIPYQYNFNTLSYGQQTHMSLDYIIPEKVFNANGAMVVVENPVSIYHHESASVSSVVYGLYKPPNNTFATNQPFVDGSGTRRLTIDKFTILTE